VRTVHELTCEEKLLHQLDDYVTSDGVRVKWLTARAEGVNLWRLEREPARSLYITQTRWDADNPRDMGPNEYAWGVTWPQAKERLKQNPRTAEVVMAEALEYLAVLVARRRLGILGLP